MTHDLNRPSICPEAHAAASAAQRLSAHGVVANDLIVHDKTTFRYLFVYRPVTEELQVTELGRSYDSRIAHLFQWTIP